jgi:hypothetical protein
VGKIALHERRSSREAARDFAHAVGREDGARVGTARELFSRAKILERRAFAHPTLPYIGTSISPRCRFIGRKSPSLCSSGLPC